MNIRITPGLLSGKTKAIPSKSQAHRMLICAAFAQAPTRLVCSQTNRDIQATAQCLTALGRTFTGQRTATKFIPPRPSPPRPPCPAGTAAPLCGFCFRWLERWGGRHIYAGRKTGPAASVSPVGGDGADGLLLVPSHTPDTIRCQGKLKPGGYQVDGGISSQFITGLLFAAALIPGVSRIQITGQLQSRPYVDMTRQAMARFGCPTDHFQVTGGQPFHTPGTVEIEGD